MKPLSPADLQQLEAALGVDTDAAVNAYNGAGLQAAGVVVDLAQNRTPSFATMGALVATGLVATGVGAPIGAVVAAGIAFLPTIAHALGIGGEDEHCNYKVGSACFHNHRAYGPGDPHWMPLADFEKDADAPKKNAFGGIVGSVIDAAFTHYRQVRADYEAAGTSGAQGIVGLQGAAPRDAFLRTYGEAWRSNAERALNGLPWIGDNKPDGTTEAAILDQVANAWRRARPTRGPMDFTFDGSGKTIVDAIIRGDVDGQARPALTLSGGPLFDPRRPGMARQRINTPIAQGPRQTGARLHGLAAPAPAPARRGGIVGGTSGGAAQVSAPVVLGAGALLAAIAWKLAR